MSKKTSYLLGMLLTIIIGTLLYCYLCDDCNCSGTTNTEGTINDNIVDTPTTDVKEATFNPFSIGGDIGDLDISSNDNFNFNVSNFSALMPVSANVDAALAKLKDYFSSNPDKSIGITGHYTDDETNNSAFPNLGLARANSVKNYLVLKGVPSKYIDTYGELKDDLVADTESILHGPVSFDLHANSAESEAELKALGDKIRANPLVLHFNTGQATINLTAEQRQKIADISRYLDKVDKATCNVVGHTDNTGGRDTNIKLGLDRAEFGKAYLVRNGIPESKINASSKGPDEPIADNATEEGRAENRRTVITIN